jgi:hypothetical protein
MKPHEYQYLYWYGQQQRRITVWQTDPGPRWAEWLAEWVERDKVRILSTRPDKRRWLMPAKVLRKD